MQYNQLAENFGDRIFDILAEFGHVTELGLKTVKNIISGKVNPRLVFEQMVKIGIESLPLAIVTSAFIGMVFALQIAGEFSKFGAGKFVGGVMAIAMARELGPAITGIVVAARVAASIAAELGTMKVTEQIDALNALGSNPICYLVVPRFIACTVMLPLITILTVVIGFLGGYFVAVFASKINSVQYLETAKSLLSYWDVYGGLLKTVIFGMLIAVIACYRGLHAKNGAKGVGEATTSSVVTTLITLFIVNYFLSTLFFK